MGFKAIIQFLFSGMLLSCLAGALVYADEPLRPPTDYMTYSPQRTCLAHARSRLDEIGLFKVRDNNKKQHFLENVSWKIPSWYRQIFLAEDCNFVITTYDGLSLLNLNDKRPETVMFKAYYANGKERNLILSEIYPNLEALPRTSSHWRWHEGLKWNGHELTVQTVDGRVFSFSFEDK